MVYATILERLKPVDGCGCQHTLKNNSWDGHSDTVCPSCTLATRADSPEKRPEGMMCSNCHTTTTPLWRRDSAGNTICNACGLYYKLHLVHRPVAMMRTVIKRRKRSEKRVKRQCKHEAKKDSFRGCATQPGSLSPTSQWEPCLSQLSHNHQKQQQQQQQQQQQLSSSLSSASASSSESASVSSPSSLSLSLSLSLPHIVLPPIHSLGTIDPSLEQHVSRLTAYLSSNVVAIPDDIDTKEHQVACSLLSLAHAGRPFSDPSESYPRLPPIQQGTGRIPTPSLPAVSLVASYLL